MKRHKKWNVWLGGKCIDTVFFSPDMTAEEVKKSLVEHDGYHPAIRLTTEQGKGK